MIFADSNELGQFVDSLLSTDIKEVLPFLEAEDHKQLNYASNTLIRKMPRQLQPLSNAKPIVPASTETPTAFFPTMFQATDKKTYEYINENIDNMKQITNNYSQMPLPRKSSAQIIPEITQKEPPNNDPNALDPQTVKEDSFIQKSQKQNGSLHSAHSFMPRQSPAKNPFVSNSINFTDKYANSKAIPQKYPHLTFNENARNLTALAQAAKYTAFSQSVAFPTTVLTGTILPPKDTTFSRQTKLNVDDVMRYTLGVKRERSDKTPPENPFLRVPKRRQ